MHDDVHNTMPLDRVLQHPHYYCSTIGFRQLRLAGMDKPQVALPITTARKSASGSCP
jgi:hypothetical protein